MADNALSELRVRGSVHEAQHHKIAVKTGVSAT